MKTFPLKVPQFGPREG